MNTKLFAGVFGLLVLGTTAGCDDTENTGGAGGTTSSSTSSKASTTGSMTTTTTTGGMTTTGSGMVTLDCASYCGEVMTNCTGANAQYNDMATCTAVCATFAAGTLADTMGDTLGCRIYHAGAPSASMPAAHCEHAGPLGGDQCIPTGGTECDSFCNEATKICDTQWPELAACKTACATLPNTVPYATSQMAGNTLACHMYHLMAASTMDPPHCDHTKVVTPTVAPCM